MGFLGVLAAIILAILFGYFALLNQNAVPLNLGPFLPMQRAWLHEIAGYSALAGFFVSTLAFLAPLWKSSRMIRALRRQVRALEEQTKSLRDAAATSALYADNNSPLLPAAHTTAVARADEEPV